jgi:hypothetical protein
VTAGTTKAAPASGDSQRYFGEVKATLEHASSTITINDVILDAIRQTVAERIAAYASDYVRNLEI